MIFNRSCELIIIHNDLKKFLALEVRLNILWCLIFEQLFSGTIF